MRSRLTVPMIMLAATIAPAAAPALAAASSPSVALDAALAKPMLLAGRKNSAQLRVSVLGRDVAEAQSQRRPEVNVCIAIDRSGSMTGDKIQNARTGAISAVRKLRDSDIVSVVAYDDVVRVLVAATRASNRQSVEAGIAALEPGGNTALFAGVVKCAAEVRKFASKNRVNRIVLLSDGMANIGPSTPAELGTLGSELAAEGISVATIGLGLSYNEDLMVELAARSDGGHVFVHQAADLTAFLEQELGALAAVVARDVEVTIRCAAGARPVRVLGRQAEIVGQTVTTTFGKIYGRRQHLFILEMETDPGAAGSTRPVADVQVAFNDLLARRHAKLQQPIAAAFTARGAEVESRANPKVMSELSLLSGDVATEQAIKLRDRGDFEGAQQLLRANAKALDEAHRRYQDPRLKDKVRDATKQAESLSPKPAEWNVQRKAYKKQSMDNYLEGMAY